MFLVLLVKNIILHNNPISSPDTTKTIECFLDISNTCVLVIDYIYRVTFVLYKSTGNAKYFITRRYSNNDSWKAYYVTSKETCQCFNLINEICYTLVIHHVQHC